MQKAVPKDISAQQGQSASADQLSRKLKAQASFPPTVSDMQQRHRTRRALVIGNDAYTSKPLQYCGRSAELIYDKLVKQGFNLSKCKLRTNQSAQQMREEIAELCAAVQKGDVVRSTLKRSLCLYLIPSCTTLSS